MYHPTGWQHITLLVGGKGPKWRNIVCPSFAPAAWAFASVLSKPALQVAPRNRGDNAPCRGCQVDSPIGNPRYRRVPADPDIIASKACDRRGFCGPSGVHRFALDFRVLPHAHWGFSEQALRAIRRAQRQSGLLRFVGRRAAREFGAPHGSVLGKL